MMRIPAGRIGAALPVLALVGVAITWGITFTVVDDAAQHLPAADLVAWRFGLATVVLLLIRRPGRPPLPGGLRMRAVVLGGLLGAGFLLQAWAMTDTDAVMAGFLIGTLVVMAPMISWLVFRERPTRIVWLGAVIATAGLAMLSLHGAGLGKGEALTVLAAAFWALHLVLLARWGRASHALELATVQTTTVTGMAMLVIVIGGIRDGGRLLPAVPADSETWLSIAFLALPATAVAMVALSWAQARVSASKAAIILALEPAAAAATAAVLGAEIGTRTIIGGALLISAMVLVELGGRRVGTVAAPAVRRPAQLVAVGRELPAT